MWFSLLHAPAVLTDTDLCFAARLQIPRVGYQLPYFSRRSVSNTACWSAKAVTSMHDVDVRVIDSRLSWIISGVLHMLSTLCQCVVNALSIHLLLLEVL